MNQLKEKIGRTSLRTVSSPGCLMDWRSPFIPPDVFSSRSTFVLLEVVCYHFCFPSFSGPRLSRSAPQYAFLTKGVCFRSWQTHSCCFSSSVFIDGLWSTAFYAISIPWSPRRYFSAAEEFFWKRKIRNKHMYRSSLDPNLPQCSLPRNSNHPK